MAMVLHGERERLPTAREARAPWGVYQAARTRTHVRTPFAGVKERVALEEAINTLERRRGWER